jgi:hypothetical protein
MTECVSKSSKNAALLNLSKTIQLLFEVTLLCRFESYTIFFFKAKKYLRKFLWFFCPFNAIRFQLGSFHAIAFMQNKNHKRRKIVFTTKQQKRDRKYISNEI